MSTKQAWLPPQPEPVRKMIKHLEETWADYGPLKFDVHTRGEASIVWVLGGQPPRRLDARVVALDAQA